MLLTESPDGEMMLRLVLRSTGPRGAHPLPPARAARGGAGAAGGDGQRPARAQGGARGRARDRADRHRDAADAARHRGDAPTGPAVLLPDQHDGRGRPSTDQARSWVRGLPDVRTVWDLYCGVGGFALHLAAPGRQVLGVEVSADAIAAASATSSELGVAAEFVAADATAYALASDAVPDLVVVNPPRRGIGPDLAAWLESSGVASCPLLVVQRRVPGARPRADAVARAGRGSGARHVPAHHPLRGDGAARPLTVSRGGPSGSGPSRSRSGSYGRRRRPNRRG